MRMHEQWWLHCTDHHWVTMCTLQLLLSKQLSKYSNEYASNFVKLVHPSTETIGIIQKATAMGNWWLAASSQQCARSHITSRAEFFGKTSSHPGDSAPLQPRFRSLLLLPFPKTKITFKREEISDHWWDSGKYNRVADGDWENCVRAQGANSEGDRVTTVLCTMFLVSPSVNVSIFHIMWLDTFWTDFIWLDPSFYCFLSVSSFSSFLCVFFSGFSSII